MSLELDAFSQKMTDELDKAVTAKPATGFFADNNLRSKFVGAKTVMIPDMALSGLGDYDRDSGFVKGTVAVTAKPYTLAMDRGRSFQLDREDNDETGIADLAGQIMGEFVRTKVVPEMDAYVLSKLATCAVGKSQTVTGTPSSQAFRMINDATGKAQNTIGYDEELVVFVNNTMWTALQSSADTVRQLVVSDFRKGEAFTQVHYLNGIAILPVPDNRMKTAFTFYDGVTEGQENGGFILAEGAKSIGLLLAPKRAASLVKKTDQVRVFDPAQNQTADAWKFDYRLYYDLFIRENLEGGIYAYVY